MKILKISTVLSLIAIVAFVMGSVLSQIPPASAVITPPYWMAVGVYAEYYHRQYTEVPGTPQETIYKWQVTSITDDPWNPYCTIKYEIVGTPVWHAFVFFSDGQWQTYLPLKAFTGAISTTISIDGSGEVPCYKLPQSFSGLSGDAYYDKTSGVMLAVDLAIGGFYYRQVIKVASQGLVNPKGTTPTTVNVIFSSSPAVATITIDGTSYTATQFPVIMTWTPNTPHTFSVESTVSGATSTRYIFTSWSDGNTQASRSIIASTSTSYTANYKTQYLLTVISDQGTASGGGWYDNGATAYATLDKGRVSTGLTEDWVFIRWSGDASGMSLMSNALVMDGPKTVTALWEKQFNMNLYIIIFGTAAVIIGLVLVILRARHYL